MRKTEMAGTKKATRKILVKELNDVLTCTLCSGYLIDATTLTDCHHVFCRGCILRYFENCKAACPSCNTVYKKKNQVIFRADPQIQSIVYKMVPGLYSREMQRREDFYRSTGVRASSSCSDDSVLERERDMINDQDSLVSPYVGEKSQFFGPEDSISLSLEYYQAHLDATPSEGVEVSSNRADLVDKSVAGDAAGDRHKVNGAKESEPKGEGEKRFLQCPAAVSMKHLQKFIRMKFALTQNHKVDVIYEGEVLPPHFSLMDVAYTFKWKRLKPLRFFYRIFTPLKIQPIKIVNTTLSTGGRQLQIVCAKSGEPPAPPPLPPEPPKVEPEIKNEKPDECNGEKESEEKERLLANLQLQSKTKVQNHETQVPDKGAQPQVQDCVFDYEEQDKEEIKRFAETRDREWAMQKKLDESCERERDEDYHHFSKKRKKNKHSKNDVYKKRKLHAEITNTQEELKLKVKLTQHNGHKHKHHKSSSQNQVEMSSKEKLLQMRQVRHKHVSSEDKNVQTVPSGSASKETSTETGGDEKKEEKKKEKDKSVETREEVKPTNGVKSCEEIKKASDVNSKTLRSDFPSKTTLNKEWGNRVPTVQIERNEQTEQQAKKTFLKSYQAYAEKYQKKIGNAQQNNKNESAKNPQKSVISVSRPSQLEKKIANLQQRCTIEAKNPVPKVETKPPEKKSVIVENPKSVIISPTQYPAGFTVSKIESGAKRKMENEETRQEKRPSLEITLINPPTTEPKPPMKPPTPTPAKRPPPATIPLDRIKKSFNFKSGISIIPKVSEKCDNIGALDLSSKTPSKEGESPAASTSAKPVNGFASAPPKDGKSANMSNLQMLSKVASEHPTLNKSPKIRPQMPSLQTLKIPSPNQRIPPNLDKLPKLINKNQFRLLNPQIRNLRPNQNQSIRNIPNPSLLVHQHNRLNSLNPIKKNNNGEKEEVKAPAPVPPPEPPKAPEPKPAESKEVSV
ncbi:unnamed protein product [Tenebrio molitor]|nr:unnamed protein product [Tenebrio molitor]